MSKTGPGINKFYDGKSKYGTLRNIHSNMIVMSSNNIRKNIFISTLDIFLISIHGIQSNQVKY